VSGPRLVHDALFYASEHEYVEGVGRFVREGLAARQPVLVAVPGAKLSVLRAALNGLDGGVEFADMSERGANPARILPFIRAFLDSHGEQEVRFVGEPVWFGRSAPEIAEAVRHEALINEAFALLPTQILCPYDAAALDQATLASARCTHPTLLQNGERVPCPDYLDPLVVYAAEDFPLSEPPPLLAEFALGPDLAGFRRAIDASARRAGLDAERRPWFLLAASEAAANTLRHAGGHGRARLWCDGHELVCELSDGGRIHDVLAGRRLPVPEAPDGRGLWLINHLCDLVELRSGETGTVVRLHMRLE
jgi:anti-sigma regulatory factor (Ser/Thr protein kinase)